MLNLKAGAAFLITLVVAVIAFILSKQLLPSASVVVSLFPSVVAVVTTVALLVVSNIINVPANEDQAPSNKSQVKPAPSKPNAEVSGNIATLYVGNLAYKANEKLVQEHFEAVGPIKSVRLVKDKKTNRRKGFGFVEVSAADEAMFIKKMNETEFMERSIIVRQANEKQH